jgi:type VI secretion system protein ImpH
MSEFPTTSQSKPASPPASATPRWTTIIKQIHQFDFFQAVRLLMRIARRDASTGGSGRQWRPVGHDYPPDTEIVRFRVHPSHSFPSSELVSFVPSKIGESGGKPAPAELTISFLGLTGPAGVLPQHYTQTVVDRVRGKDHALRDFLDLFNHRIISLFYRVWEKHRVAPQMERACAEGREDVFTKGLYCLTGLGMAPLRKRLEIADEFFLYYSGLFAHFPRNAQSLERMLADWLGLRTQIKQCQGDWLRLEPSEQTALPTTGRTLGRNCQLAVTAIAGQRVWSVENKFRVVLGPLGYRSFESLLPDSQRFLQVAQVVRTYVGTHLDFDLQLILRREEVPFCKLSSSPAEGRRLGWNSWACSQTRSTDATEAVFRCDGRPTR